MRALVSLLAAMVLFQAVPATADVFCEPKAIDCRAKLLVYINAERIGLDAGMEEMTDPVIADAVIARFNARVPVRLIVEPRRNRFEPANAPILDTLRAAGIPMRYKPVGDIVHWKTMIFAGQNTVEFGAAQFDQKYLVPIVPNVNFMQDPIVSAAATLSADEKDALGAVAAVIAIGVKNMQSFLDARELSLRDGLTGCFNRGYALEALDGELRRARRSGAPLSVLMFDVDRFKQVNDRFGHLQGDELLAAIGAKLGRVLRTTDLCCRYGGDEFLIVLPETPSLGAQQVAEMLRKDLGMISVGGDADRTPVTISIGVAAANAGEMDPKAVIRRADEALYRSKRAGRNCVSLAVPPSLSELCSSPSIDAAPLAHAVSS